MKRLIAIALSISISMVAPSYASWTFVNSGGAGSSGSTTTATFKITGVAVGDVVSIGVKYEGGTTTVTCSDTASTFVDAFVGAHQTDGSGGIHTACYTVSASSAGVVTYTITWGAARTFKDIGGMAYRPSSAASLDATPKLATGSGTTATSGNATTTSTDGLGIGSYGETGSAPTSATAAINGVTRDQVLLYGAATRSAIWSKTYSAGFTGAATIPIVSGSYGVSLLSFKTAATAPHFDKRSRLGRYE